MNKYIVLVLFFCVFITVCSNRSLVCKSDISNDDSFMALQSYNILFNSNKVTKVSIDVNVSFNEADEKTISSVESYISDAFKNYSNIDGVIYKSSFNNDGFNIFIDFDFSNIMRSDFDKISFLNYEKGYDELKSDFESNGFNCK